MNHRHAHWLSLLGEAACSGVVAITPCERDAVVEAAQALGFACVEVDLSDCRDAREAIATLAAALRFPAWFGGNWDALEESLGDLSWWAAPGYVLLLDGVTAWRLQAPDAATVLMDVLAQAARAWAGRDVPFWALVRTPR